MNRFFTLLIIGFLSACSYDDIDTGQYIAVDIVGTDKAYCILSTPNNRYAVHAPGEAFIERGMDDLKIDCDDNASDRRRVVTVQSVFKDLYWSYPEKVTVDFSSLDNGNRFNGFRAQNRLDQSAVTSIITEDSFSKPMQVEQIYPVEKDYVMGRRSMPIPLQ
jgi:hypothetical protein